MGGKIVKDDLIESVEHSSKIAVAQVKKHCLWIFFWSVIKSLLVFCPCNSIETFISIVATGTIYYLLLITGSWCGRHDMIKIIYNGIVNSSNETIVKNLIKTVGGRDIFSKNHKKS